MKQPKLPMSLREMRVVGTHVFLDRNGHGLNTDEAEWVAAAASSYPRLLKAAKAVFSQRKGHSPRDVGKSMLELGLSIVGAAEPEGE